MRFPSLYTLLVFFFFALPGCSEESTGGEPVISAQAALKDVKSFLVYRQKYVDLSSEFVGTNAASHPLSREEFLKQLATGAYLPLRLRSKDSTAHYRLHPISGTEKEELQSVIQQWGENLVSLQRMEGKPLPTFRFTDLAGKSYDAESTKGKILVLKCWFIHCIPCVKEIPSLNQLVSSYAARNDILFVSLAFDQPDSLETFLKNKPFSYAVVPQQKGFVLDTLGLTSFPTHMVVGKNGNVVRVVNTEEELAPILKREAAKG